MAAAAADAAEAGSTASEAVASASGVSVGELIERCPPG